MSREAWWATVHGVAKSWTQLSSQDFSFFFFKEGTKKEERSVELVEAARCEFSYKETLEFCDFASVRFILTIQ